MGSRSLVAVRPAEARAEVIPRALPPEWPAGGGRRDLGLLLVACLAAQIVAGVLLARLGGFWSPDSAVRFVQVQSLLASHYRDVSVPYPALAFDPEGRYFPIGGWFHFGYAGRFYLSYLPYFSMASAPLYGLFQFPGLLLIPSAAVLGTVWITYHVLRRRAPNFAFPGALALGLATPLFVYGVVFWDHSLAVVLSAGALGILSAETDGVSAPRCSRIAAGAALLGLGCWVRSEIYPLAAAAVVGWLCTAARARVRGLIPMALGMAGPLGGLWVLNTHLFGSPFGWKGQDLVATRIRAAGHAVSAGAPHAWAWLTEKLGNAYYQLASPDFYAFNSHTIVSGATAALALLLAGGLFRAGIRRRSAALIAAAGLAGAGTTLVILSGRTMVSGLLPAAPLVILAVLTSPTARWEWFLWVTSASFTAAVIATGTHGGLQWGPRYLLPILPPLLWLAAAAAARARAAAPDLWPTLRLAAAALAAASLLVQIAGIDQIWQASSRNARINRWVRGTSAEIVVTPLEWLTLGAGPVYFEKDLMLVRTPDAFRALVERLSAQRIARWAYIPFSGYAFNPRGVAGWTDRHPWRFRPVADRFYEGLRIVTYAGAPATP